MKVKFYLFLVTKAHRQERAAIKIHTTHFISIIFMITEFYYQANDKMRPKMETQTILNCFCLSYIYIYIYIFIGIIW